MQATERDDERDRRALRKLIADAFAALSPEARDLVLIDRGDDDAGHGDADETRDAA
jgi:hypothetical protein